MHKRDGTRHIRAFVASHQIAIRPYPAAIPAQAAFNALYNSESLRCSPENDGDTQDMNSHVSSGLPSQDIGKNRIKIHNNCELPKLASDLCARHEGLGIFFQFAFSLRILNVGIFGQGSSYILRLY